MNNIKIALSVLLLIFIAGQNTAQIKITSYSKKFRPPIVTMEFLLTYSQPLPNMYGSVSDFFNFKNFGVKTGFIGAQLNVKLSADKKGRIHPYLTIGYALFRGQDNGTAYIKDNIIENGYPPVGSSQYQTTPGNSKIYLHNFNSGVGFEYSFMNKTRWTPHLEADVDLNILFGTYRQTPAYSPSEVSFTIKGAARFGFGAGGGVNVRLTKAFGLGLIAKYKFANVLGKSSERTFEQNKMLLNDKKAEDLNSYLNKNRHIQYLEFGLGAVFFIGKK